MAVDPQVVVALISAVVQIANRHMAAHPNVPLTDEIVKAQLDEELADGQSIIAAEFARHGVVLPE